MSFERLFKKNNINITRKSRNSTWSRATYYSKGKARVKIVLREQIYVNIPGLPCSPGSPSMSMRQRVSNDLVHEMKNGFYSYSPSPTPSFPGGPKH